ncbi:MAG: replication initiation factor domain-containing protein [Burkholderiaceae bacterium]|nr:replication initiation factor domain-containing protein [Burkholderiaceae bacterium]
MFLSQQQVVNSSGDGCALAAPLGAVFALPSPRIVTTGRKYLAGTPSAPSLSSGFSLEAGERYEVRPVGHNNLIFERHLIPVESSPPSAAFIDALAFSVVPPEEKSYVWLVEQMQSFLDIEAFEQRRGLFGFRYSARFGDGAGVMAWGGESQRGRVFFSLMGKGCSMVKDWSALAQWLELNRATIKRVDVAYDDFEGKLLSIAWAVQQYRDDGFNAGGRKPSHTCFGDWLEGESSTKGRTLGIGNRASGKYARIYEKGKQLGDPESGWTRFEVEWRAQDRYIPFDILTRPGHYLAGAYPCLVVLNEEQSVIKTIAKGAQIAFDSAVEHAKQHCGKLVNLLLSVVGGDYAEVVNRLMRSGFPSRIDPYSYHVKRNPIMLDTDLQGVSV